MKQAGSTGNSLSLLLFSWEGCNGCWRPDAQKQHPPAGKENAYRYYIGPWGAARSLPAELERLRVGQLNTGKHVCTTDRAVRQADGGAKAGSAVRERGAGRGESWGGLGEE